MSAASLTISRPLDPVTIERLLPLAIGVDGALCFTQIAGMIDGGTYLSRYGEPVRLWSLEFRRRHAIPPDERSPFDGTTKAEASPR
jgi:hypothetical protein